MKQQNRNNPETLFNMHVMWVESLSILERGFMDKVQAYEAQEEEPISEAHFATMYKEHFKKC